MFSYDSQSAKKYDYENRPRNETRITLSIKNKVKFEMNLLFYQI